MEAEGEDKTPVCESEGPAEWRGKRKGLCRREETNVTPGGGGSPSSAHTHTTERNMESAFSNCRSRGLWVTAANVTSMCFVK